MPPAHRVDRRTTPGKRPDARSGSWQRRVVLGGGVLTAMAAWLVLVAQAITFGQNAGSTLSWVLLGLATLGAIACMFLAILLATRLVGLLRPTPEPAPRTAPAPQRPAPAPVPPTTPPAALTPPPVRRTVRQARGPESSAAGTRSATSTPRTDPPPTTGPTQPAPPVAPGGSHAGGPARGLRALRRRLPHRPGARRSGRDR